MAFVFENISVTERDGVRVEDFSRDYRLFPMLLIVLVGKAILVYGNAFWAMPRWLKGRRWGRLAIRTSLLFLVALIYESVSFFIWAAGDERVTFREYFHFGQLNALFFVSYYGISVAYVLGKNWWANEQRRQQLEKEKLRTELDFLKSQINPHFLFNSLNNLYALAGRYHNDELAGGIAELSNLMRYMLYDAKADSINLEREVAHLRSVIEIQQLRFSEDDDFAVSLHVDGDIVGKKVAPLLLIPFVENAFKHGVDLRKHSFIRIELQVEGDRLHFQVTNTNFYQNIDSQHQHSGIGLENVRRRLELLYPEKHTLVIQEEKDLFKIDLTLVLD